MHQIRHWSFLKNPGVADDICGANGSSKVYGSALFYGDGSESAKTYTGFGLFKDKVGNLVVAIDENRANSRELMRSEMFGLTYNEIWANCPIIYLGEDSKNIWGNNSSDPKDRIRMFQSGAVLRFQNFPTRPTNNNFYEVLKNIENNKTKFPYPIFIIRRYSDVKVGWNDILNVALSVASSFVSAGIVKVDKEIFERATKIIKNITSYDNQTGGNIVQKFATFAETAELFVPEWTRGAVAKLNEGKIYFGKYVTQAQAGFQAIESNLDFQFIQKLSSEIGLDSEEARKYLRNIRQGVFSNPVNLTKITGSLDNVNKTLENINTTYTNKFIEINNRGGKLQQDILTSGLDIYQTPIVNNLFQSGNASTILAGINDMNKILPTLVKKTNLDSSVKFTAEEMSGLIGSYFGYVGPEKNFKNMTLNALKTTANEYAISKIPFVIPDTIPPKDREYFAKEIRQSTSANVITYNDGWDWDSSKRKLVAPAVMISLAGAGYYFLKKR